jgi:uncharacterized protein (UPF0248 family)
MGYTLNKEGGNKGFVDWPLPKEILNELKWHQVKDILKAEIWYIHRGAPDDTMIISGKDIINLTHSFMELAESSIPYHRIFKIVYDGKVIFQRKK